ncbi:MAG: hypothetical protein ND807_12765 [Vicinamibacterales bacterium]|nr:hypothetical protein [Vicinamibacterales bacterium]
MGKPDKRAKQAEAARRRAGRRLKKAATWVGAIAAVGALFYGLANTSGVRYDEEDLGVIDFSALDASQKKAALEAANTARCTCGCGMDIAQCVATDSTCPIRTTNIDKIKKMITDARNASD